MCADKLKYLLLVLFSVMGGILLFGCNTVTPEPDPVSRSVVSVTESWRFLKSDKARAMEPDFDDDAWETVNLPHTWNAEDGRRRRKQLLSRYGMVPEMDYRLGRGSRRKTHLS